jgi:hypothetical protein
MTWAQEQTQVVTIVGLGEGLAVGVAVGDTEKVGVIDGDGEMVGVTEKLGLEVGVNVGETVRYGTPS